MARAKIAVQASTIKEKFKELGPYEALRRMTEVGYNCIELSQVDMSPESIAEMQRAQKDFGIEVCSISGSTASRGSEPNLVDNLDVFIGQCEALGCKYIRIGMMPMAELATMEKLTAFCKVCEELCKKLELHGIKLYYHNHHVEYQKRENGKTVFEIVLEKAPHLGCEVDVHWVQRGGCNPIWAIEKATGNLDLLHLKDYRIKPITPELFAGEGGMMNFFRDYFPNCVEFAEIGEGNLDWPAIIEAGLKAGSKYLIVEQDTTYGRDEYESLRISAEYLKKIGYADCF